MIFPRGRPFPKESYQDVEYHHKELSKLRRDFVRLIKCTYPDLCEERMELNWATFFIIEEIRPAFDCSKSPERSMDNP